MKYLFINSVAGVGSTGRIAVETCRELMEQGHECLLAYGRTAGNCQDVRQQPYKTLPLYSGFGHRNFSRLWGREQSC